MENTLSQRKEFLKKELKEVIEAEEKEIIQKHFPKFQ